MIKIIKELNIEVSKPNIFQAVVAKQYDMNTRFIKATLVDGGDVIYIPNDPDRSVQVVINANRPDGLSKGFDGVVNDDGTVTVPLHSWMLEMEGTVICDISVIDTEADDNKKLTTTSFTLLVEKASYGGDDVTNDPQYDVLVSLLETCQEASAVAEEALAKSNEANSKYDACVEATENANEAADELESIKSELAEGGYVTGLKESNNGGVFKTWIGTQEEYDNLETKIPNCLYMISDDKTFTDYVIEQGTTDDGWTYRKWNSGIAECWGGFGHTVSWSGEDPIRYSNTWLTINFPANLFETIPVVTSDFRNDSGAVVNSSTGQVTQTQAAFMFSRVWGGGNDVTGWLHVQVNGRWKPYEGVE